MATIVKVHFSVSGCVKQKVVLSEGISAKELLGMLESGKAFTTVQEDGNIVQFKEDGTEVILGHILDTDNELEYTDFEVKEREHIQG